MDFMHEFCDRSHLSSSMGTSFSTLIPKIDGMTQMKDLKPISLILT